MRWTRKLHGRLRGLDQLQLTGCRLCRTVVNTIIINAVTVKSVSVIRWEEANADKT